MRKILLGSAWIVLLVFAVLYFCYDTSGKRRPYPHWRFQYIENEQYKTTLIENQELEDALEKFRADYPQTFIKRVCKDYYYNDCSQEYPQEEE